MTFVFRCTTCGRFVSKVMFARDGFGDIIEVWGTCKVHGRVDLTREGWSYEDLVGWPEEE